MHRDLIEKARPSEGFTSTREPCRNVRSTHSCSAILGILIVDVLCETIALKESSFNESKMATQKRVVLGDLAIGNAEEQISGKMEREDDSGENAAVEGLVTKEMVEEEARAHVETERGFQESLKEMVRSSVVHVQRTILNNGIAIACL